MKDKDKGFTLVELIIVVSIFSILLGILVPSLNSILGFREQRASSSIQTALDKTKTEAMDRLVGEMELSHLSGGYYITYYLDHGKNGTTTEDSPEKIAPSTLSISYTTCDKDGNVTGTEQILSEGTSLIITYDRETGGFRPLQSAAITQEEILAALEGDGTSKTQGRDIAFKDLGSDSYLKSIIINGSSGRRVITLNPGAGTYTAEVSK